MNKGQWQAVFLDIDGTVFSHTYNRIPASALRAIDAARAAGILAIGATGRHRLEMEEMSLDGLQLDAWITVNGALCYDGQGVFHAEPLHREDMQILYASLKEDPFPVIFFEEDRMYMNMHDEEVRKQQAAIHTGLPPCEDLERIRENDIYQAVPWAEPERWDPLAAHMHHIHATRWTDLALDVIHERAGKKAGVLAACRHFGIDPARTIGIGDGPNDRELLEACGLGIAMGNSGDELKQTADAVTGHIDEDGLLEAFIRYGAAEL